MDDEDKGWEDEKQGWIENINNILYIVFVFKDIINFLVNNVINWIFQLFFIDKTFEEVRFPWNCSDIIHKKGF